MNSLCSRFRTDLLNAVIDLKLSKISEERNNVLRVTASLGPIRILLVLLFGIPCLSFVWAILFNASWVNLILALVFCPALATLSILFGFTVAEKSFDISKHLAIKSIIVGKYRVTESEALPSKGVIKITTRWIAGGSKTLGHREYSAVVEPLVGFGFVSNADYSTVLKFGEKLAKILSYEIENLVPPEHRK